MADRDRFTDLGRSREDDYFRKRDQELIEKMRRASADERARTAMGQTVGIDDPELLQELEGRGFTHDTVVLLPLVPPVQMAWPQGGVSAAEGDLIVQLARSRGIAAGSPADRRLGESV